MSNYKLIIFDLDDVLYNPEILCLFEQTKEILQILHKMKYTLAICSHNYNALNIVKKLGISDYFTTVIGECISESKLPQLQKLLDTHPMIKPEEMIFFDDMYEHCQTAKKIGIEAVHINWRLGINFTNIEQLLNDNAY
jgi:FMN phosphatase YigB (HAD superfamily)